MKFTDLKECPFCGAEEFVRREYVYGTTFYRARFDGHKTDNYDLYEGLMTRPSDRVYCAECKAFLGNSRKNTVGVNVEKALTAIAKKTEGTSNG